MQSSPLDSPRIKCAAERLECGGERLYYILLPLQDCRRVVAGHSTMSVSRGWTGPPPLSEGGGGTSITTCYYPDRAEVPHLVPGLPHVGTLAQAGAATGASGVTKT